MRKLNGYIRQTKDNVDLGHFLKTHGPNIIRLRLEPTIKGNVIVWFSTYQSYNLPSFKA